MEETQNNTVVEYNSGYSGYVNVTVMHGSKVLNKFTHHNAGTVELFKYIANLVSGAENPALAPGLRPGMIYITGTNVASPLKAVYSNMTATNTSDSSSDTPWAQFSMQFVIPNTILSTSMVLTAFSLYSINGQRMYANINLGTDSISITSSDISIIVEWVMGFTNK